MSEAESIIDTAYKLNRMYTDAPKDFYFVKGYIMALLSKQERRDSR